MTVRVKIPFLHYEPGQVLEDVPYPGQWQTWIDSGLADDITLTDHCQVRTPIEIEVRPIKRRK